MKVLRVFAVMAVAGAMVVGGVRMGVAQQGGPQRTIAVIDVVDVFAKLNDKKNGDAEIEKMANDLKKQRDAMAAELDAIQRELGPTGVKPDSDMGRELMDKAMKKGLEMQNFSDFMREKLTMEQRVRTAALYKKINDAVKNYAQANGIQLVLTLDKDDMADARTPQELQARITVRKVIYAADSLDITRDVTEAMNSASHLGEGR